MLAMRQSHVAYVPQLNLLKHEFQLSFSNVSAGSDSGQCRHSTSLLFDFLIMPTVLMAGFMLFHTRVISR